MNGEVWDIRDLINNDPTMSLGILIGLEKISFGDLEKLLSGLTGETGFRRENSELYNGIPIIDNYEVNATSDEAGFRIQVHRPRFFFLN